MKRSGSGKPAFTHLLDTSAVIAYLAQEPGADRVKDLRQALGIPFIVLSELYYVTWRKQDQWVADEVIHEVLGWHLPLLLPDERVSLSAGFLKARYSLGVADSFIAALALAHRATLVTKDPDFRVLQPDLKLLDLD